ncbi:hypothetical protein [Archangium lipolyticum]|uniref:hypothetical protein n=1 Tax=Archangium lipolyticum TaxID=2970465 RepID=UPI00214A4ED4|nr:hypothetical protein [Archangium lipolyticum]
MPTPIDGTPPGTNPSPPPKDGGNVTPPPDAGENPPPPPDAGTPPDGGSGPVQQTPDPWPREAAVNYTKRFGVGRPRDVAVDEGFNIWLLNGNQIGVLRPGDSQPIWVKDIGQAARGFTSTVICGGSAGRAYVGYYANELEEAGRQSYEDPVFGEGDLDVVKLTPDGNIVLEEHLFRSYRRNKEKNDGSLTWNPPTNIGLRNSNNWTFDEDRAVLSCLRVMRGRDKGEVYVGTNHGVSRIKGLYYNSHRHPVWFEGTTQRAGYTYGLGISQSGDVLIANNWTFGIVTPNADLGVWDWMNPKELNPMKVESAYLPEVNALEVFDFWRGFEQTKDGRYYLGSKDFGLWEMSIISRGNPFQKGTKIAGLPTDAIMALAATDDGSLFIGTDDAGLWRMDANRTLSRVTDVPGGQVRRLIYDPNGTPAMLYVLTNEGLTVLRGH